MELSLSPCIGKCEIDETGLCAGCRRTLEEIAAWSVMDDRQRRKVIAVLADRGGQNTDDR